MPDFSLEQAHSGYVVGLDEAGCGPWAGPVVAAAVIFIKEKFPSSLACHIHDSKKLTALKREKVFSFLNALEGNSCFSSIGLCSVEEIDALNIREAARQAMMRAAQSLRLPVSIIPSLGLADGTAKPDLPYPVRSIVKGDGLSLSIAAASIVAKVTRHRIMKKLSLSHPEYGWEHNAGYGTAYHQAALTRHGITPHHRKSFAPIARLLSLHEEKIMNSAQTR